MPELLYKSEVFNIVGAAMEVHRELGPGFLESVYQEALELEFKRQSIPYQREKTLRIYYKGILLNKEFAVDFVCYDKILVELKALSEFTSQNESQLINYLKASNLRLGLLINFGASSLKSKRMVH